MAGDVIVKATTMARDTVTGSLFDASSRMFMGLSAMIMGKSSQRVLGTCFAEAAAKAVMLNF